MANVANAAAAGAGGGAAGAGGGRGAAVAPQYVTGNAANATTRIANIMTQVLTEQQTARIEAADARAAARQPKTVGEFFKAHLTTKLMLMCRVDDEGNLPDLWSDIYPRTD